jgi:plastocyanin/LysM repeat protein
MSSPLKPARSRLPIRSSTLLVFAFLIITIVPAFVAFALTPQDAQVVTNVQGWNGCAYRVRHGDNLFRIGVRYGVTYHYLAQLNGIYNPNYIYAGQTISVPCGPVHYVPDYRPSYKKVYPPYQCPWCQPFDIPENCGPTIQYTVVAGDNLFRIAVLNGSTIQWIRTQNDLWGKVLRPNMVLNIPCQGYVKTYPTLQWTGVPPPTGGIITATFVPTAIPDRIRMRGGQFRPPNKIVQVGTTVTWENTEDANGPAYIIQSSADLPPDQQFLSGPIAPGQIYSHTFNQPGVYQYFSPSFPETMTGTITVNQ